MVIQENKKATFQGTKSAANHMRLPIQQNMAHKENKVKKAFNELKKQAPDTLEMDTQRKKRKSSKISEPSPDLTNSNLNHEITNTEDEIAVSDIEELRTVYKKCKSVMKKIEKRYGHLLGLEDSELHRKKCKCSVNKKIIFDDEGKQTVLEPQTEIHICPSKSQRALKLSQPSRGIQTEYSDEQSFVTLPDDIQTLRNILQDPDIKITYRNMVIEKLRGMRQVELNEIKFNKHQLIENTKKDADAMFEFSGSNLSNLPGYPTWK